MRESLLYNIGIRAYTLIINIAALFNQKARFWVDGRKNIFQRIENEINPDDKVVWFHVSSLGEFEQGRPVMEAFKKDYPQFKILLTFFSPSGYEIRKNYAGADYIYYLPADTRANAKKFLKLVKPEMAFFVKYEFWFNYLNQLQKSAVPTYIFSAIFRPDQLFFRWYGAWYRKMLFVFEHLFVQNEESAELLGSIGLGNVTVGGDTRFDRVFDIAQQEKSLPLIEAFSKDSFVLVAGSSWAKGEELLFNYLAQSEPNFKIILAPHEIHKSNIQRIQEKSTAEVLCYSKANDANVLSARVLIVDSIGLLSSIYRFGKVAYIGGGFGAGIHNTLEAAIYGIPVIFGPNHKKFQEALDLISVKGGFVISSQKDFEEQIERFLHNQEALKLNGESALSYVNKMRGGTLKLLQKIASDLTVK